MKKIFAVAALGLMGVGLAAPAHAATSGPSSANASQPGLAVAAVNGPQATARLASGTYVIHSTGAAPGSALGIGPVPLIFPPIPVPARYFDGGSFVTRWVVKAADNGQYTITAEPPGPYAYSLALRDDNVFASSAQPAAQWLIQPAADGKWTIASTDGDDRVVTLQQEEFPEVILRPQDGSDNQLWDFVPTNQ